MKHLLYIPILFIFFSCKENKPKTLKEGDILFQKLACGELCDAINKVTDGYQGNDFAHCAMVIKLNDTLKVIEAIGNSVQINSLDAFFSRNTDSIYWAGRLKNNYQTLIADAQKYALSLHGKPYDDVFLMDNDSYYCSEIIYEAYKAANNGTEIFALAPMTFKDPETGETFKPWEEYYKNLQTEIPEGKLGLNPGSISLSDKLEVFELKTR
jgi:uncharacterized protein YycO